MDGFTTLNVGGRVIHLVEPWNNDGEDVVLWNEYTVQTDEFQRAPLDLAIEAEETMIASGEAGSGSAGDEVEDEDPVMDEEEFWDSFADPYTARNAWSDNFADDGKWCGVVACADGEPIIHGKRTSWDEHEYHEWTGIDFSRATPSEEYDVNLPGHIGLWRAAVLDPKRFWARRTASPWGYNTYLRKDLVRVEPIRRRRRGKQLEKNVLLMQNEEPEPIEVLTVDSPITLLFEERDNEAADDLDRAIEMGRNWDRWPEYFSSYYNRYAEYAKYDNPWWESDCPWGHVDGRGDPYYDCDRALDDLDEEVQDRYEEPIIWDDDDDGDDDFPMEDNPADEHPWEKLPTRISSRKTFIIATGGIYPEWVHKEEYRVLAGRGKVRVVTRRRCRLGHERNQMAI